MQFLGSFRQSVLHRNLCQANQPMGGVRARPLSKQIPLGIEFSRKNAQQETIQLTIPILTYLWISTVCTVYMMTTSRTGEKQRIVIRNQQFDLKMCNK